MRHQKAYLFIPDDPRLRARASQIAEQRRHSLAQAGRDAARAGPRPRSTTRREEQLSLFAALSAVATDHEGHDELDRDDVDDDLPR